MNLFYAERGGDSCAGCLDDRRLVTATSQAMQVTANIVHFITGPYIRKQFLMEGGPESHDNMLPLVKWVKSDYLNYTWFQQYSLGLHGEYTFRFNREHKYSALTRYMYYDWLDLKKDLKDNMPCEDTTLPPSNVSDEAARRYLKNIHILRKEAQRTRLIKAYRSTLNERWRKDKLPPVWTKTHRPAWYIAYKKPR